MEDSSRKKVQTLKKRETKVAEIKEVNKKEKQSLKFIRVSSLDKKMLVEIGIKVSKGEVKWSYYAVDNDVGYHYFFIT